MILTCMSPTNPVLCRKCNTKYHCRECFEWHQRTKTCQKQQVTKLLGEDIHDTSR